MGIMSDAGFLIDGRLYPFAENLTFADAPLVREVTGLEFDEFAERVDRLDEGSQDILAVTGLLAIAVSRSEPSWNRARIGRFLAGVDVTSFDVQAPDIDDAGSDDDGPPAVAEPGSIPGSSGVSTTSPAVSPGGVPV